MFDIAGNNFGNKGAHDISEVLKVNSSLTWLNIGNQGWWLFIADNAIESTGASYIADALKVNSALARLEIRNIRNIEVHFV